MLVRVRCTRLTTADDRASVTPRVSVELFVSRRHVCTVIGDFEATVEVDSCLVHNVELSCATCP